LPFHFFDVVEQMTKSRRNGLRWIFAADKEQERRRSSATSSELRRSQR
jgi:hypothetical protein